MFTSSLQFHCDPRELNTGLLRDWLRDVEPIVVVERTDGRIEVTLDQLTGESPHDAPLVVGLRPFTGWDLPWTGFLRANHDFLAVMPGQMGRSELRETIMGGGSEDPSIARLWRAVVRRARDSMHRGATLVSHAGRFPVPSHRYTEGALNLANKHFKMLAVAGANFYELDRALPGADQS